MNIEEIREICLAKPFVNESMPFGDDTLVFKVLNKIFAQTNFEGDLQVNLKCDPERALHLREMHHSVLPGYHMNKKHWNTITLPGDVPGKMLVELIDHSYRLVWKGIPTSQKSALMSVKTEDV